MENSELQAQIDGLATVNIYAPKINLIAKENISQTEQISILKDRLKDLERTIEQLKSLNEKLSRNGNVQLNELRQEKADLVSKNIELTKENWSLADRNSTLEAHIILKNTNIEGLKTLNESLLKDNYELKERLDKLKQAIDYLRKQ